MKKTLFISDLHLDESRPQIVERFGRFLQGPAREAEALYILGDLFEYWVGDDGLALPFPARIGRDLAALASDVPVSFMHGNRDFLVQERFARDTGVKLLPDPTLIDLYGTPTVLMHGDTLCIDDRTYQAFRAQVRDPGWQRRTLGLPIEQRIALARGMRDLSDNAKHGKPMEIMDVTPAEVERVFAATGAELMIHGHTHRPARHVHDGRVRWVLPDWYEGGGYLEASPAGIRAVEAP